MVRRENEKPTVSKDECIGAAVRLWSLGMYNGSVGNVYREYLYV